MNAPDPYSVYHEIDASAEHALSSLNATNIEDIDPDDLYTYRSFATRPEAEAFTHTLTGRYWQILHYPNITIEIIDGLPVVDMGDHTIIAEQ